MLAYFNINSVSRDGDWKGLTLGSLKVAILPQNIEGLMTLSDQKLHAIMAFVLRPHELCAICDFQDRTWETAL